MLNPTGGVSDVTTWRTGLRIVPPRARDAGCLSPTSFCVSSWFGVAPRSINFWHFMLPSAWAGLLYTAQKSPWTRGQRPERAEIV